LQHTLIRIVPGLRRLLGDRFHYFKGIKSFLRAKGYDVRHANLNFAGSVRKRTAQLGAEVQRALGPSQKVHMIAHSMGGLDARHMIVNSAGMAEKVATLTTIGTPHHGTVFADHGLSVGGERLIVGCAGLLILKGSKT
jgi:triacylglycerol esterase/lipase EstA (alpha/beta hydrolase family)